MSLPWAGAANGFIVDDGKRGEDMNCFKRTLERGFSLHKINYMMAGVSLLISLLFLVTAHQISRSYDALLSATREYNELSVGAYELQEASDYLSGEARSFAMTGNRVHLDNYFREATEARRREAALEKLKGAGETSAAYRDLQKAMEESVELMNTEYASMKLTVLAFGYSLSDYPEAVRNTELPDACEGMAPWQQKEMARNLVLNDSYRERKGEISQAMKACLAELLETMTTRQIAAEGRLQSLISRLQVMVLFLICMVFVRILLTSRLVIGPLLTGVLSIREGQQLPIQGAYEFRFLARTYNQMYEENRSRTERLTFEVNHDKLTGVYNRSGYDYLMSETNMGDSALLLVDVDEFKSVNDTYGHNAGDNALIRVADSLRHSFGNDGHEDFVCRIGGDEFAVILRNTGPESKKWIERQIALINKKLRRGTDEDPAVSVSVGCAFGSCPNGSGALAKDADAALYRVKENGRCGCAFYC